MAAEEEEEEPGKLWGPAGALSRTSSDKDSRPEAEEEEEKVEREEEEESSRHRQLIWGVGRDLLHN